MLTCWGFPRESGFRDNAFTTTPDQNNDTRKFIISQFNSIPCPPNNGILQFALWVLFNFIGEFFKTTKLFSCFVVFRNLGANVLLI